ncbi:MAG: hypothetical protein DHS20C01_06080 [marine bacterium B5-7]|nr:MAG: hypothetical protein DHS20C01_06080 [marine bacterium B5-7]
MVNTDKEFLHSLHPIMDDAIVLSQSQSFRLEKIPCCYLLHDKQDDGHVIKLNDSGILIWHLCSDKRTVGEIVDLLADGFEQPREDMARDVSRVVEYLIEERALLSEADS